MDWACDASPEGYALAIDALAAGLDETRNAAQRMRQIAHKAGVPAAP